MINFDKCNIVASKEKIHSNIYSFETPSNFIVDGAIFSSNCCEECSRRDGMTVPAGTTLRSISHPNCVSGDTRIAFRDTDKVFKAYKRRYNGAMYTLIISGRAATFTANHPIWSVSDGKFKPASCIHKGEFVLTSSPMDVYCGQSASDIYARFEKENPDKIEKKADKPEFFHDDGTEGGEYSVINILSILYSADKEYYPDLNEINACISAGGMKISAVENVFKYTDDTLVYNFETTSHLYYTPILVGNCCCAIVPRTEYKPFGAPTSGVDKSCGGAGKVGLGPTIAADRYQEFLKGLENS